MAEFVQKRLEELLPELEQLERVQLFSKDEVRSVIKKRKEFEYRLQRKRKAKEDYVRYIEYEKSLLKLIWKRRERLGYRHKQAEIDHKIVSRISQLYRIACIRFSSDVSLFLAHVAFCRQMRQLAQGSRVFSRLLRIHCHRPDVWEAAARYELEENNSAETARQLMLRALRLHPESVALWIAHFRLELNYVDLLRRRQNLLGAHVQPKKITEKGESAEGQAAPDHVLEGAVARAVARQAVRRLLEADAGANACRLLVGFLAVCREFGFAEGLENELREELQATFPQRALTYDTLARAALQGGRAPAKLRHRLEACCELYEQGLTVAPADEVWPLYLSSLVETARAAVRHRHLVLPRLEQVLGRACQTAAAPEASLLQVAELYAELGLADRLLVVLRAGTEAHPACAALWWNLIQTLADHGDADDVCAAFEAAAVAVPDSAAGAGALWRGVLQWAAEHRSDYVEHVFAAAAARSPAVLRPLKAAYLRWLAAARGLQAARQMFAEHQLRPPLDAELFETMVALEAAQQPADVARLREAHRAACRHVGTDRPDLWLDYVRFETERGTPQLATAVYREALTSLEPHAADMFVAQHARMMANADGE